MYELMCQYDTRESFYGKARVVVKYNENNRGIFVKELYSYNTLVARVIDDNKETRAEILGQFSSTTTRHQKEFLLQEGFKADNMKQMLKDYGVKGE